MYLQPKSSQNRIAGMHNGELKVHITAPPVDGKANQQLIVYLAKLLGFPKANVTIIKGLQSRHKTVEVLDCDEIPLALMCYLG
ncbi:DUF167 family protein YggU [Aliiglaciecola litoralis]|uniref:UPF0235 protein GCM10009114_17950 n=1 Tax=Aliiglaciecola litoralis TaxID=582857 RepID=A0ABN1LI22_9ALTE